MGTEAGGTLAALSRLRGRRAEIDMLDGRLHALSAGRGGTVLVTGLAGMGKTALTDAAAEMARTRGISVFRGAGDIAGQVTPLGPLLAALLSAPGAPVDAAVLRDLSQSPGQRFWLLREVQEVLERAALRAPLLVAIDDAQWADEATVAALGTLTRQLATHRILWLLAARPGGLAATVRPPLSRVEADDVLELPLGPLAAAAVADLTADLLGGTPDAGLTRVLDGVQGNPFLLTELLRGLREEKLAVSDGGTARLTGTGLPLRFRDSVSYQIERLSPEARDALQMASVLGRRFSAAELAALTGTGPAVIGVALREALQAGLVVEDGDRMRFRHDLLREAVDAMLPRTVRRSLRRQALEVMLAEGAPPSDVAEIVMEVARPGETEAITVLRRAAAEIGRVSPAIASQLSRRALELSPPGDPGRGPLTAETLAYLVFAGRAAEAVRLMTVGAGDLTDPVAQAEARLRLAILSNQYEPADSIEQCRRALELPGVPAKLRIQLQSNLALALDLSGDVPATGPAAAAAASTAGGSGDPASELITLLPRAVRALSQGGWRDALRWYAEATASQAETQGVTAMRHWTPDGWYAVILIRLARLEEAGAITEAGLRAAQERGILQHIRPWAMVRSRVMYAAGQLSDARGDAEAAIEMADETGERGYGFIDQICFYILGRVALHTGDPAGLDQARQTAARLRETRTRPSARLLGGWLTALIADAESDPAAAGDIDIRFLDPLVSGGLATTNPQTFADYALLTRILLAAGRTGDAAAAVTRLEDLAARYQDFPFLDCAARHARAVLDTDPDAALEAVALSEGDPRPLVRARVLEDAGRVIPDGRAAQAVPLLQAALAAFAGAGAERDAARVRGLLRARGVRPATGGPRSARQWPELTESEYAVVSLVARGATNREAAERLYLSAYTVNSHLRHVFAKLGIRSRTELARLAAGRGLPGTGEPAEPRPPGGHR
jgi:DNA-binding CsgD family transcriptional regulator